ncbi:uncharacterized protein LOC111303243 [Durio zibethinus]|uniref:Uncharacterized protein LOC111303243 n=1 Tax=Durio zibethinus TaxID=66656 RepID=A0A6P5ZQF8_DURZI|nr:uncharacterized protein LOC111303243 [Durio zibethinus]
MVVHAHDEKLLMHVFQDNLTGSTARWVQQLINDGMELALDLYIIVVGKMQSWSSLRASHLYEACGWKGIHYVVPDGIVHKYSATSLKLDDKDISTRDYWKRKIIVASGQKRPSSFGLYSPAKDDAEGEGGINKKRIKASRLACIESRKRITYICSDLDSVSCDNEILSREESIISEDEAEIVDLMNRVEKERSILWLREFKDWMDHASENFADAGNYNGAMLYPGKDNYKQSGKSGRHSSESSRYVSDSVQASGDESSMIVLESVDSFADTSTGVHAHRYFDHIISSGITVGLSLPGLRTKDIKEEYHKCYLHDETSSGSMGAESSRRNYFAIQRSNRMVENASKDLLHRCHNLVEEILQLSAESYSVASYDSDTSCSEDDYHEDGLPAQEYLNMNVKGHFPSHLFEDNYYEKGNKISHGSKNGICFIDSCAEQTFSASKNVNANQPLQLKVALALSSEEKLYVLLVGVAFDVSGWINTDFLTKFEDISEVLVGLGLQVVRVCVERSVVYLFITRSIEESTQLLHMLKVADSCAPNNKCSLRR